MLPRSYPPYAGPMLPCSYPPYAGPMLPPSSVQMESLDSGTAPPQIGGEVRVGMPATATGGSHYVGYA